MVEDDKADEEAEGVVKEVTKVLLDFGVLWKQRLTGEKSYQCVQCSFACVHLSVKQGQHTGDKPYE